MNNQELVAKYAANVSEFKFGHKIKLCYSSMGNCKGWKLYVLGVAGGYVMNFSNQRLYATASTEYRESQFFNENLAEALELAEQLYEEIGDTGTIASQADRFVSRFLNEKSKDHFIKVWNHYNPEYI